MLHIIWSIVVGFIVGLIARALLPGADHMGFLMTTIVGVAGSLVGGFVGRLIKKPAAGEAFHTAGFIMSVVGAFLVLILMRFLR